MAWYEEPAPWVKSIATTVALEALVDEGLLPPNTEPSRPVWIAPRPEEREPKPPSSYTMSLMRLHERGFGIPTGRFVRALCDHYGVELHNFAPNSISQVAVIVAICEGNLGVKAHWELWLHLFSDELYTEHIPGQPRRVARAGGLTLQIREKRGNLYIPCKMTTNTAGWS